MTRAMDRRTLLQALAGIPLLAACGVRAQAAEPVIARLIGEARALPADATVAQRIDLIARALHGVRYRANTLIGGPQQPEEFVVRDDAFDCVTYCETVLAAALARDYPEFEAQLRKIRYANGEVRWDERNHYFSEWSRQAVEHGFCVPVADALAVTIGKTVNWGNLGRRQVSMRGIPRATLLANRKLLASGDIVGFVSRRPALDFFHTGFIAFGRRGELLLRHASQSRGRVLDERMDRFVAVNGVRHVTLLRAVEKPVVAGRP
ncbi:MAG: N-acetylmuramoyl-L-alanine amidase-like domain-containing protein [Xanthobacteraceae bacterium]